MNGDICFSLIRNGEKYHYFGRLLVAPGVRIVTVISYSLQPGMERKFLFTSVQLEVNLDDAEVIT